MRYVLVFLLSVVFCTSAFGARKSQVERALELPVGHFKETMRIDDDPLETVATFSTADGFKATQGLLRVVWSDAFLRGFIDKQTGLKHYQVYVVLRHTNGDWHWPYQANYGRPLRTTEARRIGSDVDCSVSGVYGSCKYEEHAVFDVDEEELRRVQRDATPQDFTTKVWGFKLKNKSGNDYDDGLLLAEIVALLEVMDSYEPVPSQ